MTALLVVLTFLLFAGIDWWIHRRRAAAASEPAPAPVEAKGPEPVPEPVFVAGYQLPEALHYHPGHTWARVEGADTVVVGVDDFAARLTGRADRVRVPAVGQWVRQGTHAVRVEAHGRGADLVSPVEGEVVEVNGDLKREAALATWDPYGRGWLFKVRSHALAENLRNLLAGRLARRWTEDDAQQLQLRLMALSGSVLQDGGTPAPDFARHLDAAEWRRLTEHFFLS